MLILLAGMLILLGWMAIQTIYRANDILQNHKSSHHHAIEEWSE